MRTPQEIAARSSDIDRLQGKVAMITGAASGIGAASVALFSREGASVAICDIDGKRGAELARAITQSGGNAQYFETDVRSQESVQDNVENIISTFGKLDILFNCAGGSLPQDTHVADVDLDVWNKTISLDLLGIVICCKVAIPQLIRAGGGAVVSMSSGAALRGSNDAHIYSAAKGGVVALTRAMAGAYAKNGIRVNAICSGRVDTDRIRQTYGVPGIKGQVKGTMDANKQIETYPFWFGRPEDIANIALFLASNESRMITGAAIPADGGRSAY